MQQFTTLSSKAIPLDMHHVDTDMIIPAQYLTLIDKQGFGEHLFQRLRDQDAGFVFNDAQYQGSQILLARENFGCGSSREHAVWALLQAGIRVVIAESFSDIFYNNAAKNGLLLITLSTEDIAHLFAAARTEDSVFQVDLAIQEVTSSTGLNLPFEIEPYRKECLLLGRDDLDYLLATVESIE